MNQIFQEGKRVIPSGVNSPVRAFGSVGGAPVLMAKGKGPYLWDELGKRYIDFCCSWGPLLFGHAPTDLVMHLRRELNRGTSFGTATAKEIKLAQEIALLYPNIRKVRLVSSGTEAVMSAIRLARGFTGRKKILKIDGGYHGHVDSLLIKAGSGLTTFGVPDSAGVPEELAKLTLSVPFNDVEALEKIFKKEGKKIAAFILEPIPANMGVVLPKRGYLEKVRELTKEYGVLLIFDEVITGFRVAPGGAQEHFRVRPDLTCLGKILGGGFPLAAFGGRRDVMDALAPQGNVYQAGTLSGNPIATRAALWMISQIKGKYARKKLDQAQAAVRFHARVENFYLELQSYIYKKALPVQLNSVRSMFTLFFNEQPVTDFVSAKKSNTKRFARFFHACLKRGLYLAPSQFEANFISFAHTDGVLKQAMKAISGALSKAF